MFKLPNIFRLLMITALTAGTILSGGCAARPDFDKSLREITAPYRFSILEWELDAFGQAVSETFSGGDSDNGTLERTIELQVEATLAAQGIYHPADRYIGLRDVLPPVNFSLEKPPHLLVISPRDRIEEIKAVLLVQELSVAEMEAIEEQADALGVSSLVVNVGGISTYPSFVTDDASLRFIINTAVEEWLHQYLFFRPLGFLYALDTAGIRPDYEIATMNESFAGIFSRELGGIVYQEHYASQETDTTQPAPPEFDFNAEMRNIRKAVDAYLASGEIEAAEMFMESRRRYLETKGYHIRKLNQAYFAFHGTYADRPAYISPIGTDMEKLRSQSDSLKDFLDTASALTNRQELALSVD